MSNGDNHTSNVHMSAATYRLQLHHQFKFDDALSIVSYLKDLGVDTCYLSPILKARSRSLHGYDTIDHGALNPEIGTLAEFQKFAEALRSLNMKIILDVVPNHMCIADPGNRWWTDVLENGPSSPYADYFDIDWHPPKTELANKVLLPFLGDQYGRVLDSGEIQVVYENGSFWVTYYNFRLPVTPKAWVSILDPLEQSLENLVEPDDSCLQELKSILTALGYLPDYTVSDTEKIKELLREKEVIKGRFAKLYEESSPLRQVLGEVLIKLNGVKDEPRSFGRLEALLAEQPYRLCFWRVAADEINYRRFFDIDELAAIRVEKQDVFQAVHELPLEFIRRGWVTGLRVDHVDGLLDPHHYLTELKAAASDAFKVAHPGGDAASFPLYVEKILSAGEKLNRDWPVAGTTGYEILNLINGLFVEPKSEIAFRRIHKKFTDHKFELPDLVPICKKLIMLVSNASELRVLAFRLDRISEQHRWSRDFTQESLRFALREVIACFPFYRSYIRPEHQDIDQNDRQLILSVVREAKQRNPSTSESIFDFIGGVLLLDNPDGLSEEQIAERKEFVLRFQQFTGPIMAKGVEDTAFYRYAPLLSLNEVGGSLERFGIKPAVFHRNMKERSEQWPGSLSATSTHDTKRSEDVRARINVLSEIPHDWSDILHRWPALNKRFKKTVNGRVAPDPSEECMLYQTLIGAWPTRPMDDGEAEKFHDKIQMFMQKAMREAKLHTSWIRPDQEYEAAVREFVSGVLDRTSSREFLDDLSARTVLVSRAGLFNSLSQTLLKITSPGVPDIYQGTETMDFSLVDPDNRRPVDYKNRADMLGSIRSLWESNPLDLVRTMLGEDDGSRLKLFVTWRSLITRKTMQSLFQSGSYQPLRIRGDRQNNLIGFTRHNQNQAALILVSRFFCGLDVVKRLPVGGGVWNGTQIDLPDEIPRAIVRDVFTNKTIDLSQNGNRETIAVSELLNEFPISFMVTEGPA